jgi:hypothetical protein
MTAELTHCVDCKAYLKGGMTEHAPWCWVRCLIEEMNHCRPTRHWDLLPRVHHGSCDRWGICEIAAPQRLLCRVEDGREH